MNPLAVRPAGVADLDELSVLFDQYRQFQGRQANLPACRAFLHDSLNHAESVVFLATVGSQAAGFAQLYPSLSSIARKAHLTLHMRADATARRMPTLAASGTFHQPGLASLPETPHASIPRPRLDRRP